MYINYTMINNKVYMLYVCRIVDSHNFFTNAYLQNTDWRTLKKLMKLWYVVMHIYMHTYL